MNSNQSAPSQSEIEAILQQLKKDVEAAKEKLRKDPKADNDLPIVLGKLEKLSKQFSNNHSILTKIGYFYEFSVNNTRKAAELYTKASKSDPIAGYYLAVCTLYGVGVKQDEKKALEHYTKAATQGHSESIGYVTNHFIKEAKQANSSEEIRKQAQLWATRCAVLENR